MIPSETCPLKSLKVNRDGSYKVFSSRAISYSAVSSHQQHLHQKRGIAKKLILTLRAIMSLKQLTWLQVTSMVPHGGTLRQRQPQYY